MNKTLLGIGVILAGIGLFIGGFYWRFFLWSDEFPICPGWLDDG